jgi:phosphoserine phosphatase RsbU/P
MSDVAQKTLRILHLEDDPSDAYLVRRVIENSNLSSDITLVHSREEFLAALAQEPPWDIVVADNALPTFTSREALALIRERSPSTPFIVLSGAGEEEQIVGSLQDGVADYILKDHLPQLVVAIHRLRLAAARTPLA